MKTKKDIRGDPHVVTDGTVNIATVQIESAEHDPGPEHDAQVDFADQLLLLFGSPLEIGIETMAVLVASIIVDATPVIGNYRVLENVLLGRAVAVTLVAEIVSRCRRRAGRMLVAFFGRKGALWVLGWRGHGCIGSECDWSRVVGTSLTQGLEARIWNK